MKKINVLEPCVTQTARDNVQKVLQGTWLGQGPVTEEFEKKFAAYVGSKYAILTNSCTSSIQVAVKCWDLQPGDFVISPSNTFPAATSVLKQLGLNIIFADTLNNGCLNIASIPVELIKLAKGIIPVSYAGQDPVDEKMRDVISSYKLKFILDNAHACGSTLRYRGDSEVWSFHCVKNLIGMGDGGAITTNDEDLYIRMKKMVWFSINKNTYERESKTYSWQYNVEELGFKAHGNDANAGFLLGQLEHLPEHNARRKSISSRYQEEIKSDSVFTKLHPLPSFHIEGSSNHLYVRRFLDEGVRNRFINYMEGNNISVGVHYYPNHLYKPFKDEVVCSNSRDRKPDSEAWSENVVSLPVHPNLTNEDLDYVIETINNFK